MTPTDTQTKKARIKKLEEKYRNLQRLYDRSMRMAKKYSDRLRSNAQLISKLSNRKP